MLRNLFIASLMLILNNEGWCQSDQLIQLTPQSSVKHKYINFDVLKVTIGSGLSPDNLASHHPYALSWNIQLLYPYACLKNYKIHIAYGISIGRNAIAWKNTEWNFSNNKLIDIKTDNNIERSVQKTDYVGLVILPFIQVGSFKQYTIMAGTSINFNILGSKMIYKSNNYKNNDRTYQQINKVSTPLLLQASKVMNASKTISLGVYSSYDLMQRFKGEKSSNVKQIVVGLSGAIIL